MIELTESQIKTQICDWLELRNALPFITGNKGKNRYKSKYFRVGIFDVCGIWKGRPLYIEVKKEKGILSEEQADFMHKAIQAGAIVFVAFSLEDVILELEEH